jgi:hypothetical protein
MRITIVALGLYNNFHIVSRNDTGSWRGFGLYLCVREYTVMQARECVRDDSCLNTLHFICVT